MTLPNREALVDVLTKSFESWEYLAKARKTKGLDNWKKLLPLSEKLVGKKANHITFTCSHPSHAVPQVHHLGSNEGNLHFLLGYGNPGFHLAPYHMQIIDPNVSEEDAEKLAKKHPSKPTFWKTLDVEVFVEGDRSEGKPHASAKDALRTIRRAKLDKFQVTQNLGTYTAIPVEGIVYGDHKEVQYSWDLVKDSYFSSQDEKMESSMELVADIKEMRKSFESSFSLNIPDCVTRIAKSWEGQEFSGEVYNLVSSKFPQPGTVLPLRGESDETIYGVITKSAVEFYDRDSNEVSVRAYDRWHPYLSIEKGGNIHPSVLLNFICGHMGIMREDIAVFSHRED